MLVIEGMDNSGKSTLARLVADRFGLTVQESEGPPRSVEEMAMRLHRYDRLDRTLFVRHPCVSNIIYDRVRPAEEAGAVTPHQVAAFYSREPFLIYCDPLSRGLGDHVIKEHDTPEHIQRITDRYYVLLQAYRNWAACHAHICYRIGDDVERVLLMIEHAF